MNEKTRKAVFEGTWNITPDFIIDENIIEKDIEMFEFNSEYKHIGNNTFVANYLLYEQEKEKNYYYGKNIKRI